MMIWLLGGYIFLYVYRPWEVFPSLASFYPEKIYMLTVMAYWAIWPGKSLRFNRVYPAMVVFFLVMVVSWIISAYRDKTFDAIETHAKIMVFFVLFVTSVKTDQDLRALVWFFVASVAFYALHSYYEYLGGRYEFRMDFKRLIGVDQSNNQSNLFAALVVTPLPFLAPLWYSSKNFIVKLALVGFLLLVGICVALTGSRGGYITLAAFAFMQAICLKNRKTALAVLVVGFILVNLMMPGFVINRFMTLIDSSAGPQNAHLSAMGRVAGLLAGLRLWSENPMLGTGPYSFIYSSGLNCQAHNMIGQLTGDLGTGGVVTFIALLFVCFYNLLDIRKRLRPYPQLYQSNSYHILQGTIMILVLNLIYGAAGHNLYRFQWYWAAAFNTASFLCLQYRLEAIELQILARQIPVRFRPVIRPGTRTVQKQVTG